MGESRDEILPIKLEMAAFDDLGIVCPVLSTSSSKAKHNGKSLKRLNGKGKTVKDHFLKVFKSKHNGKGLLKPTVLKSLQAKA